MFSFKSKTKHNDVELNQLDVLNIPAIDECCYASCYCEENVWKLCEFVQKHQPTLLPSCYAVFISNNNQTVALWYQKSGESAEKLAIWDYHVIFLYKPNCNDPCQVYDLDTILPFPFDLEKYAKLTFRSEGNLPPNYHRYFRVIPSKDFLLTFASDRSRMKRPDGSWIKEPPAYPCIATPESTNNIDDFISMDSSVGVGEVMNLPQFLTRFQ
ncbi:protein N-terminal glutamine amidohydrolase [Parasteatoda tepidariorum]|uniref:protein N-terminal glutamine amidohydrolase n=1 Tax=Parasteatoda tepidariorum TaxID=114398 RepID=UPI00077F8B48|nr:protein N-terminal glutamine amidohydrolase [Parasteatoda tepidariorum]XP_042903133.1 protein N-terminal glutamine amidohydrolase [Parasteatoda tepidariorum]